MDAGREGRREQTLGSEGVEVEVEVDTGEGGDRRSRTRRPSKCSLPPLRNRPKSRPGYSPEPKAFSHHRSRHQGSLASYFILRLAYLPSCKQPDADIHAYNTTGAAQIGTSLVLGAPLAVVAGARSDDVCVDFLGPPSLVSGFGLRGGVGGVC